MRDNTDTRPRTGTDAFSAMRPEIRDRRGREGRHLTLPDEVKTMTTARTLLTVPLLALGVACAHSDFGSSVTARVLSRSADARDASGCARPKAPRSSWPAPAAT